MKIKPVCLAHPNAEVRLLDPQEFAGIRADDFFVELDEANLWCSGEYTAHHMAFEVVKAFEVTTTCTMHGAPLNGFPTIVAAENNPEAYAVDTSEQQCPGGYSCQEHWRVVQV